MTLAVEERLPYGQRGFCQFLLLILIVLMIFPVRTDFSQDQEQDQDHEQEWNTSALRMVALYGITNRAHERSRHRASGVRRFG